MTVVPAGEVAFDDGILSGYPDQRGWWTGCPSCGKPGLLTAHEVTFPYDYVAGCPRVTITPSCVCACGAHWFVTLGTVKALGWGPSC